MKFYIDNKDYFYWNKISINKLTAVYGCLYYIYFFKNGKSHNVKNTAYIRYNEYKEFWLNNKLYGTTNHFTKQSWRKFVKLQAFL
jgi:hypothetical protein